MICLLCDRPFQASSSWYDVVLRKFPPVICERCRESFEAAEPNDDVEALFTYNAAMKDYMERYKFGKDVALAQVFRSDIYEALRNRRETIIPVPLHRERLHERTFSQVHYLLEMAHIPYANILKKAVHDQQSKKTLAQRQNNKNRFLLQQEMCIQGQEFIIVDDIYTTGATVGEIKNLLLSNGAKKVSCFVLVKVKSNKNYLV
ncbi:MAG: ComF family protein [Caryophanon sp.]|nr:ComF family protein [Caryophanon sp.]